MARHASFNIAPAPVAVQRQVSSAPSSPRCDLTGTRTKNCAIDVFFFVFVSVLWRKTLDVSRRMSNFVLHTSGLPNQPMDYSRKTISNSAACNLQSGNNAE